MFDIDDGHAPDPMQELAAALDGCAAPDDAWLRTHASDRRLESVWSACPFPQTLIALTAPLLDDAILQRLMLGLARAAAEGAPDERASRVVSLLESAAARDLDPAALREARSIAAALHADRGDDDEPSKALELVAAAMTELPASEADETELNHMFVGIESAAWSLVEIGLRSAKGDQERRAAYRAACERVARLVREAIPCPSYPELLAAYRIGA